MSKTYQAYRCDPAHKLRCKAVAEARGVTVTELLTVYVDKLARRMGVSVPDDSAGDSA
jgi:antitoxin component of RelBE/YafQ-DinJ toxin-antitoxin module